MKTPEYYARIGYEDHGYVAPELSSLDEYPEYLRREVAESAEAIRGNQTPGSVTAEPELLGRSGRPGAHRIPSHGRRLHQRGLPVLQN